MRSGGSFLAVKLVGVYSWQFTSICVELKDWYSFTHLFSIHGISSSHTQFQSHIYLYILLVIHFTFCRSVSFQTALSNDTNFQKSVPWRLLKISFLFTVTVWSVVFPRVITCHLFLTTKITRKNPCKFRNCKCCRQVCFSFVSIWALLTGICYLTSERFLGMLTLWVQNLCNCHAICSGRLVGYWAIVRVDKMIVQSQSRTAKY